MKTNSRQHYVPQFYLKAWQDGSERIWCYPVSGGDPFHTAPENVACEKGLYTHPPSDGGDPLTTEKTMGRIEDVYAPV